jgi:hypothetical protein
MRPEFYPIRVRGHVEPSTAQDDEPPPHQSMRRGLLIHVIADERGRLSYATSRELLDGVTVDERLYHRLRADKEELKTMRALVSTFRPDVPPGVAGASRLADVGALGKLINRRGRLRSIPIVAFDIPWTLGRLSPHAGRGSSGGMSLCLAGCGAPGADRAWADSFDQARITIRSRGPGQAGAFVSWGVAANPAARPRSKRPPAFVDLRVIASAVWASEIDSGEEACSKFAISWPALASEPLERLRAEAAALAGLHAAVGAALASVAPGLAPQQTWSAGSLASRALREA